MPFLLGTVLFLAVFHSLYKMVFILSIYFSLLYGFCSLFKKVIPLRKSFTVCMVSSIIIFYFFSSITSIGDERLINKKCPSRDHYCNLASSLMEGRLDIPREKISKAEWWDMSLYKDKLYIYFGITPVLTLFLPVRIITGYNLHQAICLALFLSIGYIFSLLILSALIRNSRFKTIPDLHWSLSAACMGISPFYLFILRFPMFYTVAIASGVCYSLGGVYWLIKAIYSGEDNRRKRIFLFLSGLFCALAVGCRPHLIIVTFFALLYFVYQMRYLKIGRSIIIYEAASYLIPYVLYGVFLGIYNYLRFDSFFEFGVHYQMNPFNMRELGFRLSNLIAGVTSYLFTPISYRSAFPYFFLTTKNVFNLTHSYLKECVVGIFFGLPVVIMLGMLPSFIRDKSNTLFFRLFLTLMTTAGFIMLLIVSVVGPTVRYECDFAAYMLIPSLLIFFNLEDRLAGIRRHIFSAVVYALVIYSMILNICISFTGYYNSFLKSQPELYDFFKWLF